MRDYIERNRLKTVIEKNFGHVTISPILQLIDEQPTADVVPSTQQWIPCSERLPENENSVLVTTSIGDVTDGKYWHKEQIWVKGFLCVMEVTAWMPLPEPWKGGKNERNS